MTVTEAATEKVAVTETAMTGAVIAAAVAALGTIVEEPTETATTGAVTERAGQTVLNRKKAFFPNACGPASAVPISLMCAKHAVKIIL